MIFPGVPSPLLAVQCETPQMHPPLIFSSVCLSDESLTLLQQVSVSAIRSHELWLYHIEHLEECEPTDPTMNSDSWEGVSAKAAFYLAFHLRIAHLLSVLEGFRQFASEAAFRRTACSEKINGR